MGWIECSDGQTRWGSRGAAGVLFVCHGAVDPVYFLVHRAGWVDQGGTYGIPGGALDPGETPMQAAIREVGEEVGDGWSWGHSELLRTHVYAPCPEWSYTTFVVSLEHQFEADTNSEAQGHGWFTESQMRSLPLISELSDALPQLVV